MLIVNNYNDNSNRITNNETLSYGNHAIGSRKKRNMKKNICIPIMTTFEKKTGWLSYSDNLQYRLDSSQRGNKHDIFTHTGVLIRK